MENSDNVNTNNKYKKLANNTFVLLNGNLGSKIISFFMIRYYTSVFSTEKFGLIDVLNTTANFIIPIVSLGINEAVFRFSLDEKQNKSEVIKIGIWVTTCGNLLLLLVISLISFPELYSEYLFFLCFFCFASGINNITFSFCRGIGQTVVFSIFGIAQSIFQVFSAFLFISFLKLGIEGYFMSMAVSNLLAAFGIIIVIRKDIFQKIKINKDTVHKMVKYSLPLIANSICWWIISSLDRYVIFAQLSANENGLYAAASKIPTLINVISSIFFQAWQISAVNEIQSEDSSVFYSNVFMFLHTILMISASLLMIFIKPVYAILVGSEFVDCWKFSPFLIIATIFSCYGSFFGTNYVASKKTIGAFKTSLIAASVNLILNILLTKAMGLNGTAIATLLSYVILFLLRWYDTRNFVVVKINVYKFVFSFAIILVQAIGIIYTKEYYVFGIISFLLIFILYLKEIHSMASQYILSLKRNKNAKK